MQAGLVAHAGVANDHPLLVTVLVEQAGAVQIETVTAGPARQAHHRPAPQRGERTLIDSGVAEEREKARQRRLTGDLAHGQKLAQHRVRPQPGDVRQPLRPAQNPGDESQRNLLRRLRRPASSARAGLGRTRRQQPGEKIAEAVPAEEAAEGREPGAPADFLIGEADSDRL
jgi:hypothetical protein